MADALARSFRRTLSRAAPGAALAGVLALGGIGLGGCVQLNYPFAQPPVDVTSPIAEDLRKANPAGAPYPSFLQVPEVPQDVRPTTAWTRNIYNTLRLRRQMRAMAVIYPQTLKDPEGFLQDNKKKALAPLTPAEAAAQSDKTDQFAKDLRDRAKAPSPAR
ncbi:MAG: hypothetical protein JWO72_738 [Caulobacteraceae bacterium]|nr:hypothetical protein [Caulobacteraceae bacterium]